MVSILGRRRFVDRPDLSPFPLLHSCALSPSKPSPPSYTRRADPRSTSSGLRVHHPSNLDRRPRWRSSRRVMWAPKRIVQRWARRCLTSVARLPRWVSRERATARGDVPLPFALADSSCHRSGGRKLFREWVWVEQEKERVRWPARKSGAGIAVVRVAPGFAEQRSGVEG